MVSPSEKREAALSEMLGRLGSAKTKDERYNNGYAHFSLAVFSSYGRAFELRNAIIVSNIQAIIVEAVPIDSNNQNQMKAAEKLIGQSVDINRPLFQNTMTLTQWVENFYQESPSINARAREDQVKIGMEAFKTPAITGWQFADVDKAPEAD